MTVRAGVVAAAVTALVGAACARRPVAAWERTSYRGTPVSLSGGVSSAAGLLAGALASGRPGMAIAVGGGAAAGAVDDHFEGAFPAQGKGFSGHIGALRDGKVTSGVVKIAVIGATAAASAASLERSGGPVRRLVTWGIQSATIAGAANLVNLLDLRPGRALKVGVAAGAALVPSPAGAAALGTSLAALPSDVAGNTMLGDTGANALGAALGYGLAASPRVRFPALAGIVALTALSERVSFSRIIESNPALAYLDGLGRR